MSSEMRTPFQLTELQPFSFSVEGRTYTYPVVTRLACKMNLNANIEESIVETSDGTKVWLTVVGDEDQQSPFGILRGWYVATVLPDESAAVVVKAFNLITGE
jgi:hypothetical protein